MTILEKKIESGEIPFHSTNAQIFYVLSKGKSKYSVNFRERCNTEEFWDENIEILFNVSEQLFYLKKIGCDNCPQFYSEYQDFLQSQNYDGRFLFGRYSGVGPIRALIQVDRRSENVTKFVNYFINNWGYLDLAAQAEGILALSEYDFYQYEMLIKEMGQNLIANQKPDGYFEGVSEQANERRDYSAVVSAEIIHCIARVYGSVHPAVETGIQWLIEYLNAREFEFNPTWLARIITSLQFFSGAPLISIEEHEWQQILQNQKGQHLKAKFFHTSPIFSGSSQMRELQRKYSEMISNARNIIRITSPYTDMLYEDLIEILEKHPDIELKLITKPQKDVQGARKNSRKTLST